MDGGKEEDDNGQMRSRREDFCCCWATDMDHTFRGYRDHMVESPQQIRCMCRCSGQTVEVQVRMRAGTRARAWKLGKAPLVEALPALEPSCQIGRLGMDPVSERCRRYSSNQTPPTQEPHDKICTAVALPDIASSELNLTSSTTGLVPLGSSTRPRKAQAPLRCVGVEALTGPFLARPGLWSSRMYAISHLTHRLWASENQ